tara:strand:+ start:5435 stop:6034 length:600 start_codon:yes stop_codon:yes gene_type:complete
MPKRCLTAALAALCFNGATAHAGFGQSDIETFEIPLPEIGENLFFNNGGIPFSNEFDGGVVIDARLEVVLRVDPAAPGDPRTSSAAHFFSELVIPVDTDLGTAGNQLASFNVSGADEGWSGTGTFTISRQLDWLIGGVWASPVFYSASTYPGLDSDRIVLGTLGGYDTSYVSVTVRRIPAPGTAGAVLLGLISCRRRRR